VFVGLWLFVYRPLDENDQFTERLWGPLINPDNAVFDQVWKLLGKGLGATMRAAVFAIVFALAFGLVLGVLRIQLKHLMRRRYPTLSAPARWSLRAGGYALNGVTRVCVEVLRGTPVVITIFFAAHVLPAYGIRFDDVVWYLVIGLTAYNGIVIAEVVRSGMEGLPKGQREAATALGLSSMQTTMRILLPQAVRIMLPALISQLVVVVKDTSLGFIIPYMELLNTGKLLSGEFQLGNPLQMYFVVGLIFLTINYALSRLADWTQRRLSRAGA
jgi:glutamate transport system permease protein